MLRANSTAADYDGTWKTQYSFFFFKTAIPRGLLTADCRQEYLTFVRAESSFLDNLSW